ncbi:Endoribonuclease L-PSP/chorismate mutase-like protein [Kockiozyma suomiensis]|uniref:Endoribonuclease L-PSP/chorismate mutase-like protein n=1 Tax=Kockiozyma suomiensis TaxID=1337062 RepID=UPI003343E14A
MLPQKFAITSKSLSSSASNLGCQAQKLTSVKAGSFRRALAKSNNQSVLVPSTSSLLRPRYFSSKTTFKMPATNPALTIVSTNSSAAPRAPYSQAVKVNDFIYCSGQIPMTPEGVVLTEIQPAALQCLNNLKAVLEAGGSDVGKIFKVNVYLTDMEQFGPVNEVYSEFFGEHRPARTCIAIKQLPLGAIIEIECIALA